jgi:hypothetical protein
MNDELKQLLQMLISVIARGSFQEDRLRKIVIPSKSPEKYVAAYNLCDGKHSQTEIVKITGLDKGNLSRVIDRWISAGVIFELGEGSQVKLLHLYPLTPNPATKPKTKGTAQPISESDQVMNEATEITDNSAD